MFLVFCYLMFGWGNLSGCAAGVPSVGDLYSSMLKKGAQIRRSGQITDHQNREGSSVEDGQEPALYPGKTTLDLYVVKARVGWDALFVKVAGLHKGGCSDLSQVSDVAEEVRSLFVRFDQGVSGADFDSLFCARFQRTESFSLLKASLGELCSESNMGEDAEIMHAIFGVSQVVLCASSVDTLHELPAGETSNEEAFLQQFCRNETCYPTLLSNMYGPASSYALRTIAAAKKVEEALGLWRLREQKITDIKAYANEYVNKLLQANCGVERIKTIDAYMKPVLDVVRISQEMREQPFQTLKKDCELLDEVDKSIKGVQCG